MDRSVMILPQSTLAEALVAREGCARDCKQRGALNASLLRGRRHYQIAGNSCQVFATAARRKAECSTGLTTSGMVTTQRIGIIRSQVLSSPRRIRMQSTGQMVVGVRKPDA